jgi:hypothetical protein
MSDRKEDLICPHISKQYFKVVCCKGEVIFLYEIKVQFVLLHLVRYMEFCEPCRPLLFCS